MGQGSAAIGRKIGLISSFCVSSSLLSGVKGMKTLLS